MTPVYHSTSPENARAIIQEGFRDGEPVLYPDEMTRRGVFVSDRVLPRDKGDDVVEIDWNGTADELDGYGYNRRVWRPHGNDYCEWLECRRSASTAAPSASSDPESSLHLRRCREISNEIGTVSGPKRPEADSVIDDHFAAAPGRTYEGRPAAGQGRVLGVAGVP